MRVGSVNSRPSSWTRSTGRPSTIRSPGAVDLYDAVDSVRWSTVGLRSEAPYDALFELGFFVVLPSTCSWRP